MSLLTSELLITLKILAEVPHLISAWLCMHLLSSYLRAFFCRSHESCQGWGCCQAQAGVAACTLALCSPSACRGVGAGLPPQPFRPQLIHADPPSRVPINANRSLLSTEPALLLCNCWEMKTACSCSLVGVFSTLFLYYCMVTTIKSFLAWHFI